MALFVFLTKTAIFQMYSKLTDFHIFHPPVNYRDYLKEASKKLENYDDLFSTFDLEKLIADKKISLPDYVKIISVEEFRNFIATLYPVQT